jgi:hypothetical protein
MSLVSQQKHCRTSTRWFSLLKFYLRSLRYFTIFVFINDSLLLMKFSLTILPVKYLHHVYQYCQRFGDTRSLASIVPFPPRVCIYTWTLTYPTSFDSEDRGRMCLRNVGNPAHMYTVQRLKNRIDIKSEPPRKCIINQILAVKYQERRILSSGMWHRVVL